MDRILAQARQVNPRVWMYATVLVAFFLRAWRLADKNIWWDEGWTIWLAQKDLAAIALRTASDEHPPLHYWLVHFWQMVAGLDVFAARFLSLAFGVLLVALVFRIGAKIGGARWGLLAALFLALARFEVWWSQDVKNYTLSAFFAWASVWFVLALTPYPSPALPSPPNPLSQKRRGGAMRAYAGYVAATFLALFSHYLAGLVFLANNLYFAVWWGVSCTRRKDLAWRERFKPLVGWSLAQVVFFALFAPWMYLYLQNAATWSAAPAFDFALFLRLAATVLPLGVTTYIEQWGVVAAVSGLIAAVGVATILPSPPGPLSQNGRGGDDKPPRQKSNARWGALLATLIVVVPPVLIYVLALTPASFFAPKIQARYLVILTPAYFILVALGVRFVARYSAWLAAGVVVFVLGVQGWALNDYYAARVLRDEYFTLTQTINTFSREGDAVALNTDQEWPTWLYYLRVPVEWVGVPNGARVDDQVADQIRAQVLTRHNAVWVVTILDGLAKDPARLVEKKIAEKLPRQFEQTFDDKRLTLYADQARDMTQARQLFIQHPARRALDGYDFLGYDLPIREARVGDTLHVATYWQVTNAPRGVEVALVDADGQVVRSTPLVGWEPGTIRLVGDLTIPASARAGDYSIRLKFTDPAREGFEIARVHGEPRVGVTPAGAIANPRDVLFGDAVRFVGFDLPGSNFRAGEAIPLTLYWKADRAVDKSYTVFVHLLGQEFNRAQNNFLWGQVDSIPVNGALPTTAWSIGEVIRDAYALPILPNAPAETYRIEIGLYDAATGVRLKMADGTDALVLDSLIVR